MGNNNLSGASLSTTGRIQSVDFLRGLVMVLMAIDHVRVYSGIPAGGADPAIFFTRWITHFCAPSFAFFAGTSAFLYGIKINNKGKLAVFLVTRGLLLVVLELTLLRFFWAFHVDFSEFILAGVIWMLGWCLILLAAVVWMSPKIVGILGVIMIVIQQLFSYVPRLLPVASRESFGKFWEFIYPAGFETFDGVSILYVIVPWVGVMAAGYGFGLILKMEEKKRNRICLSIGLTAITVFVVVGSILILRRPSAQDAPPFLFALLGQNKYPPSQLFLLMTLGPVIALVPFANRVRGWFSNALVTIGRVPFFYYMLHILIIHLSALVVQLITGGATHSEWYNYAPYTFIEENSRWSLSLLYLVFAIDVTILFFICKWYSDYKIHHPEKKWLSYI